MSELSDEARALLAQVQKGQLDDPSAADRARLRHRLAATLALSTMGGAAASAALPKSAAAQLASASLSTKIVVASLVVASAGAAAVGLRAMREPTAPSRAPVSASAPARAVVATSSAAPKLEAVEPRERLVAPADEKSDALPSTRKAAARRGESPASAEPVPPPSLQAELALITAAQEALRAGRPQLALQRVAEHAARFPNGALIQERLGVDAIAACTLGERERGLAALKRLARRAPNAPLLARARTACREPDAE